MKVVELESKKARLERFLSNNDRRPNWIKRNLYNSLGWNAIAVVESPHPELNELHRSYHFLDSYMAVNPRMSFMNKLQFLIKPEVPLEEKLAALKVNPDKWKRWIIGCNEVTNDGEIAYANEAASEAPGSNEDFFATAASRMQLANPASQTAVAATDVWSNFDNSSSAIAGSNKVYDAAFPKRNDGDADNTGAGVDIVSFLDSYTTGDFNDGGTTIKNFAILDNSSPVAGSLLLTHGQIAAFNKTSTDTLKFFINHEMRRV